MVQKHVERFKVLEMYVKGHSQGQRDTDLGANWKSFISWVYKSIIKFLSLKV